LRLVTLKTEVDSGGRCETPVEIAGRLAKEDSSRHAESEYPGVVINYHENKLLQK